MFEEEMLAWSKESQKLKSFVKQIQIENKKLQDIIIQFEHIITDYMHENQRLKQDNQSLSLINYSSMKNVSDKNSSIVNSDFDVCHLTLKWLTYEVAQRLSSNCDYQQTSILFNINSNEDFKEKFYESQNQVILFFFFLFNF